MENIHLTESVRVLHSAVNMGLVESEHGAVAIDTGLDKQAGKQLLKAANEWGKQIVAIVNTHAHADHFGGNHAILAAPEMSAVQVYAPVFEADVIRRPQYEPEYLWHGATPLLDLRNKFFEAKPSPVTHEFVPGDSITIDGVSFETVSLKGHSLNQTGIFVKDVFFAADSYFAKEVTTKHGIPFMVDYHQTIDSARLVLNQKGFFFVPGHGEPVDKPPVADVSFLTECHEALFDHAIMTIRGGAISFEQLIRKLCLHKEVSPTSIGSYVLIRTSVSAYVTAAVEEGIVNIGMDDGQIMLTAK